MNVPGIVQSRLDGEQVAAQVPLGGEDVLFVTRTRTLIYRADGLLSDESIEEYAHDAERIEISEGRRKSAVKLDYGIDGEDKFKVPSGRLYEALHPVLAGVLNAAGVTGPEETVKQTYQFSELTLVITSERVVKHVGAAVWDRDHEEFHFEDVTTLDVEEGSVSSQIIIESDGRPQRIKTPSDQTREVRERIEQALLDYYDVGSYEEFAREYGPDEPEDDEDGSDGADDDGPESDAESGDADPLAGGVDPIDANPPELDDDGGIVEDGASAATDDTGDSAAADGEPATDPEAVASRSGDVTEVIEQAETTGSAGSAEAADSAAETESADATDSAARDEEDESGDAATETGELVSDATTEHAGDPAGGFADSGFEPASSELEVDGTEERLDALTEVVKRQNELLVEQQRTLEALVEELDRK